MLTEAPCCCVFFEFAYMPATIMDKRPAWVKALLYLLWVFSLDWLGPRCFWSETSISSRFSERMHEEDRITRFISSLTHGAFSRRRSQRSWSYFLLFQGWKDHLFSLLMRDECERLWQICLDDGVLESLANQRWSWNVKQREEKERVSSFSIQASNLMRLLTNLLPSSSSSSVEAPQGWRGSELHDWWQAMIRNRRLYSSSSSWSFFYLRVLVLDLVDFWNRLLFDEDDKSWDDLKSRWNDGLVDVVGLIILFKFENCVCVFETRSSKLFFAAEFVKSLKSRVVDRRWLFDND